MAALYAQYAPLIHARAGRMVGEGADDIVQEVFERFVNHPPSEHAIASWFFRTTTNLCLDRLRHRGRRNPAWREELARAIEDGPALPSLDAIAESRGLARLLAAKLSRTTCRVVALVYLDGMTQDEAAGALRLSRKSIGNHLRRFHEFAATTLRRDERD